MTTVEHGERVRRVVPEVVAAVALALIGTVAWVFAPATLPLHWGPDGFSTFASSLIVLVAVPWSCALAASVLTRLPRYRESPKMRLWLPPVISGSCLLLALVFVAVGSPPLSGPE